MIPFSSSHCYNLFFILHFVTKYFYSLQRNKLLFICLTVTFFKLCDKIFFRRLGKKCFSSLNHKMLLFIQLVTKCLFLFCHFVTKWIFYSSLYEIIVFRHIVTISFSLLSDNMLFVRHLETKCFFYSSLCHKIFQVRP